MSSQNSVITGTHNNVKTDSFKVFLSDPGGGYSHSGLTGGPVRAKEGQSKNFENYPQMAVSFYKNPQMVVHKLENWISW